MRFGRKYLLILTFFSLSMTSCGHDNDSPTPRFVPPIFSSTPPALHYFRAQPDCRPQNNPRPLSRGQVFALSGERSAAEAVDLSAFTSGISLSSATIASTTFGGSYVQDCPKPSDSHQTWCENASGGAIGWRRASASQALPICDENNDRHSYEAIALSAAYALEQSGRRAVTYDQSLSLEPITLNVIPTFKTILREQTNSVGTTYDLHQYLTDNLSYFPSQKMISVHPQSQEEVDRESAPFWESAFAMTHEYGHHIENTILSDLGHRSALRWDPRQHSYQLTDASRSPFWGDNTTARVWTAISESFADLAALYLLESSTDSLVGLTGLGQDRNPLESVFRDRATPKIITPEHIESLYRNRSSSDARISIHRPHLFGAMIAHGLDAMFRSVVAWQQGDIDATEQVSNAALYRLNNKWFALVANQYFSNQDSSQYDMPYLSGAFESLLVEIRQTHAEPAVLDHRLCQQLRDHWPGVAAIKFCRS